MKSDREFLDQIYEKAKQYDFAASHDKKLNKWKGYGNNKNGFQILVSICLTIAVLAISLAVIRYSKETIPGDAADPLPISRRSIVPFDVEPEIETIKTTADLVLTGQVERNYEENGIAYSEILIDTCYLGEYLLPKISVINTILETENYRIFAEKEKILIFLSTASDGTYKLTDTLNGKFTYSSNSDNQGLYTANDGTVIYQSELYKGLFEQ